MTTLFRHFIFSIIATSASIFAHAELAILSSSDTTMRDTVIINKAGYGRMEKQQTSGEDAFSEKEKIVRDAFRKREIKKQKDQQALPAMRTIVNKYSKDVPQ